MVHVPQLSRFPRSPVVAVPTGLALHRTTREDTRTTNLAAGDDVDDTAVDATDVSHRGEACVEGLAGSAEDVRSEFGRRELKPELPSYRARKAQVDMGIDEPRSQKHAVEVDCPRTRRRLSDRGDNAVAHAHVDFDRVGARSIRDLAAGKPYVSQRDLPSMRKPLS